MNVKYLMLLAFILVAVCTDMTQTRISNRLIVVGLFVGLVLRIFEEGWTGIFVYIVNISIPVILLFPLFCLRALGAGDIKLFSMVGAFITREQLLEVVWMAFLIAAICGVIKILHHYVIERRYRGMFTKIHFSPFIAIAYLISSWRCMSG